MKFCSFISWADSQKNNEALNIKTDREYFAPLS